MLRARFPMDSQSFRSTLMARADFNMIDSTARNANGIDFSIRIIIFYYSIIAK